MLTCVEYSIRFRDHCVRGSSFCIINFRMKTFLGAVLVTFLVSRTSIPVSSGTFPDCIRTSDFRRISSSTEFLQDLLKHPTFESPRKLSDGFFIESESFCVTIQVASGVFPLPIVVHCSQFSQRCHREMTERLPSII